MGLKTESYPFDWIFSNPNMIIDIIKDDFKLFLDRTLYTPHPEKTEKGKCGHKIYGAGMFNHRNPLGIDEHYSYYKRCVDRFRRLLQSKDNKLFIVSFSCHKESDFDNAKKSVIELNTYLRTKTNNHYICVIYHIPGQDSFRPKIVKHENILFFMIYAKSTSSCVRFNDPTENKKVHELVLENYKFKVTPI